MYWFFTPELLLKTLSYEIRLKLVFCKHRSSCLACTMKTLISAVVEEPRFDIFNKYQPFNFNFQLLFIEKDVSYYD